MILRFVTDNAVQAAAFLLLEWLPEGQDLPSSQGRRSFLQDMLALVSCGLHVDDQRG